MIPLPPAALLDVGQETLARLERTPAHWICHHEDRAGVTFDVEMRRTPRASRATVHVDLGDRREHLATIVDDGTYEYVLEDGAWSRWRSREAPLRYPQVRVYIEASTPSTIEDLPEDATVRDEADGVTTLGLPLPPEVRARVRSEIDMLRSIDPRPEEAIRDLHVLLRDGFPLTVSDETGLIVGAGALHERMTMPEFGFLPNTGTGTDTDTGVDASVLGDLRVDGTWTDRVAPIPEVGLLISHCPYWEPGITDVESDLCLLDVETGATRRVPFDGAVATSGCLTDDGYVIVAGLDRTGASLYEIDLSDGTDRRMTVDEGVYSFPVISPDGRMVGALHMDETTVPGARVVVVDRSTGEVTRVTGALDVSLHGWGDRGLLVEQRGEVVGSQVLFITPSGEKTIVGSGTMPAIYPDLANDSDASGGASEGVLLFDGAWRVWRDGSYESAPKILAGALVPTVHEGRIVYLRGDTTPMLVEGDDARALGSGGLWSWPRW